MKTKIIFLTIVLFGLLSAELTAQAKLGDNPTNVNPNVLLELESSDKGLLIPRLTSSERDTAFTINIPNGLILYNTTEDCLQVYKDSIGSWVCVGGISSATSSYSLKLAIEGSDLSILGGNSVDLSNIVGRPGPAGARGSVGPPGPQGPPGIPGSGSSDNQTLTLSGTTLSISRGNSVALASVLESSGTDSQTLSLLGDILSISGTNSVSLAAYYQNLSVGAGTATTSLIQIETGSGITLEAGKNIRLSEPTSSTIRIVAENPLISVTENNNTGYRLADADPKNHGNIGTRAIDLSNQTRTSTQTGATGDYAFASGAGTTASGDYSTAMGGATTASGDYSTAMGANSNASGFISTALGRNTLASGSYAIAWGTDTTAESYGQTALGIFNTPHPGSPNVTNISEDDRLLVIGNGSSSSRSDALVMLKNGDTELNGALTLDAANNGTGYTLPTAKGTAGQVLTMDNAATGTTAWSAAGQLEKVTENNNTGYRLADADPDKHGNIGTRAIDLSYQTATSTQTGATGNNSTAMGTNSTASGSFSIVMGYNTTASGVDSTAMGSSSTASGEASTAMGNSSNASGDYSTAMGFRTTAETYGQTTLGFYNTPETGNATFRETADRLLVIGNGSSSSRSDALVMLKNGNTTLNGDLKVKEVQGADSGNADMKAYIYGLITLNGTIKSASSSGFTVTKTGTGTYRIVFTNPPSSLENYMIVATLHGAIGFITASRNRTYIEIKTYNTSENLTDIWFNFVVFKK
jgi:hypothetical protein